MEHTLRTTVLGEELDKQTKDPPTHKDVYHNIVHNCKKLETTYMALKKVTYGLFISSIQYYVPIKNDDMQLYCHGKSYAFIEWE